MISAWLVFFLEGSTTCDNNWDRLPAQGSEQGDGFLAPSLMLSGAAEPSVPSTTQTSSAGTGWLLRNPKAKDFSSFFTEKSSLGNEHVWGTEVVLLAASSAIKGFQKSITASFGGVLALLKKKKRTKTEKKKRKVPQMTPLFLLERELGSWWLTNSSQGGVSSTAATESGADTSGKKIVVFFFFFFKSSLHRVLHHPDLTPRAAQAEDCCSVALALCPPAGNPPACFVLLPRGVPQNAAAGH